MDYLQIAGSIPFSKFLKKQRTKKKVRKTTDLVLMLCRTYKTNQK